MLTVPQVCLRFERPHMGLLCRKQEDHEALAAGVVEYENFDAIEMAHLCEKHGERCCMSAIVS